MPFSTSILDEHSSGDAPQPYGARLKALRESKGLSIEQVAEATHVLPEKIGAIEAGTVLENTPAAYARGFVRIYAEYLEADVEAALDAFDELRRPQQARLYLRGVGPMTHKDYRPSRGRNSARALKIAALVIVIAAFLVGAAYVYVNLDEILGLREQEPAPRNGGADRSPNGSTVPDDTGGAPTTAKRYELKISAKQDAAQNVLLRVEQDGILVRNDEAIAPGKSYTAVGSTSVRVTISDASLVQVYKNGELVTDDLGSGPVTFIYDKDGLHPPLEGGN